MTSKKQTGRELILIAFGAVGIILVLQAIYQKLVFDTFHFKNILGLVIAAFLCIRVLLKNEWGKYGSIIWALINIVGALKLVFVDKVHFYITVVGVFCFLIAVLTFSSSVDSYLTENDIPTS